MMLDIKKDLADFLSGKEDPCTLQGILKGMGYHKNDRQLVRDVLAEMVKEGKAVRDGSRYWVPDGRRQARVLKREKTYADHTRVGRISIAAKGYGFVSVDAGRDWMVPADALKGAQNGDTVRVQRTDSGRMGRTIAEVVEILEFGRPGSGGRVCRQPRSYLFQPFQRHTHRASFTAGFPQGRQRRHGRSLASPPGRQLGFRRIARPHR